MVSKNGALLSPYMITRLKGGDIIPQGSLGVVVAQAGMGKTALMVQLALNAMLKGKKVLHISLNDPVTKVNIWYRELFNNSARQAGIGDINEIWQTLLSNRFIMTFKVEGFNVPKLEERLTDLIVQGIFVPELIIIDGLAFQESDRETIISLKTMANDYNLRMWFTAPMQWEDDFENSTHHEIPSAFLAFTDLFQVILKLDPKEGGIFIEILKGELPDMGQLFLDPSTMLIKCS